MEIDSTDTHGWISSNLLRNFSSSMFHRCTLVLRKLYNIAAPQLLWKPSHTCFYFLFLQVDLDLGNYERFLDVTLTRDNNITTGKIYQVSTRFCFKVTKLVLVRIFCIVSVFRIFVIGFLLFFSRLHVSFYYSCVDLFFTMVFFRFTSFPVFVRSFQDLCTESSHVKLISDKHELYETFLVVEWCMGMLLLIRFMCVQAVIEKERRGDFLGKTVQVWSSGILTDIYVIFVGRRFN